MRRVACVSRPFFDTKQRNTHTLTDRIPNVARWGQQGRGVSTNSGLTRSAIVALRWPSGGGDGGSHPHPKIDALAITMAHGEPLCARAGSASPGRSGFTFGERFLSLALGFCIDEVARDL